MTSHALRAAPYSRPIPGPASTLTPRSMEAILSGKP